MDHTPCRCYASLIGLSPRYHCSSRQKKFWAAGKVAATTAFNTATCRNTMEFGSKRRKLDHGGQGIRHKGLIDFESRDATRLSAASTFVLKTDELLKETKLDSAAAFKGLDSQLHKIKAIIDSIEPHDAIPVRQNHQSLWRKPPLTSARFTTPLPSSKRSIA